jgi:hypothetical protein
VSVETGSWRPDPDHDFPNRTVSRVPRLANRGSDETALSAQTERGRNAGLRCGRKRWRRWKSHGVKTAFPKLKTSFPGSPERPPGGAKHRQHSRALGFRHGSRVPRVHNRCSIKVSARVPGEPRAGSPGLWNHLNGNLWHPRSTGAGFRGFAVAATRASCPWRDTHPWNRISLPIPSSVRKIRNRQIEMALSDPSPDDHRPDRVVRSTASVFKGKSLGPAQTPLDCRAPLPLRGVPRARRGCDSDSQPTDCGPHVRTRR